MRLFHITHSAVPMSPMPPAMAAHARRIRAVEGTMTATRCLTKATVVADSRPAMLSALSRWARQNAVHYDRRGIEVVESVELVDDPRAAAGVRRAETVPWED